MISFARPVFALAAVTAPIAAVIARRFFTDAFVINFPLGAPGGPSFKAPWTQAGLLKAAFALELAGVFALFFAAAGPRLVSRQTVYLDRGADVLFVLDCSPSMAALDMGGSSRFDAARELIGVFVRERPADAVGLVGVGSDAALLIPPTTDRGALRKRLESLRLGELGDGTALGMGISTAALHLSRSTARGKVVALVTDGENNGGAIHPETAAAALREAVPGVSFFVFAVGSFGETPIDYVDPRTGARRAGVFQSGYDERSLIRMADAAGGLFLSAPGYESLRDAFAFLNESQAYVSRSAIAEKARAIHGPFIAAGILLLCVPYLWRKFALGAFL